MACWLNVFTQFDTLGALYPLNKIGSPTAAVVY